MSDDNKTTTVTDHHDADTTALFDEYEQETKQEYKKCSISQTFDNVFQCYSKLLVTRSFQK